jgi:hypothetical protein
MDLYVVLAQGSFRYGALCHRLDLLKAEDLLPLMAEQLRDLAATIEAETLREHRNRP